MQTLNRLFAAMAIAFIPFTLFAADGDWNATLKLPFASDTKMERGSFDIKKDFDLSTTDEVRVTLSIDKPEAAGSVSLYFQSGGGWYSMSGTVKKTGRQTLVFSLAKHRVEGKPDGLDKINQLRLSFWRGKNVDAAVELHGWEFFTQSVVILEPENTSSDPGANKIGRQLQAMLMSSGVDVGSFAQTSLTAEALKRRNVVILPLNATLTAEQVALLKEYVETGGKLIALHALPNELRKTLGFATGSVIRSPEGDAAFAEVRFEPWFIKEFGEGTPTAFEQRSWAVQSLKPLAGSDNYNARAAAVWYDASGKSTGNAALLVSDRGAFFSHILMGGDDDRKQAFMLSLLSKWAPDMWKDVKDKRLENLYAVGEAPFETESEKASRLAKIAQKVKPIADKMDARQFNNAFPALRKELSEQYIRSLPSVSGELRLWWEHAGTGAYPGDWDRTMKELKENGFNAVIPNMLWGGLAHYDSKLLPRSQKFEQYGDQIEQAVRAGKKYGVQVHVWKVNFNAHNAPKEFIDAMRQAGRTQVKFNGEQVNWLCPSHLENRKLEWESMVEVAKNYDVDGIHFDYIRYPGSDHCYCDGCRERFEKHVGEKITDWPKDTRTEKWKAKFDDWRCDQITALVADVHRESKKVKPAVKISAAVFPKQPESRGWVLQDWPVWVEKGYLDFLCPMNYTSNASVFDSYVESQMKIVAGRMLIYPGICADASDLGIALAPDQIATQIMIARKHGAPGFTIFNLSREKIQSVPPALRLGPTRAAQ
ncbi:MAG: family 10 glycosylhydrolase [Planctomycetaceae bacterium]|nr:family 10 glycosylhydrolase [Planctomycetaceae bacterium]